MAAAKHPAAFPYAKVVYGTLIAGLGTLATALEDERINGQEVITIIVTMVVALGAVFGVTGTELTPLRPRPRRRDEPPPPPPATGV